MKLLKRCVDQESQLVLVSITIYKKGRKEMESTCYVDKIN